MLKNDLKYTLFAINLMKHYEFRIFYHIKYNYFKHLYKLGLSYCFQEKILHKKQLFKQILYITSFIHNISCACF